MRVQMRDTLETMKRTSTETLFTLLSLSLAMKKSDRSVRGRIPNECYVGLSVREYWEDGEHHVEARSRS